MLKKLLIYFALFSSAHFIGQTRSEELAKLEQKLTATALDTNRVKALLDLAAFYSHDNELKSFYFANQADSLSTMLSYPWGQTKATISMALAQENSGAFFKALQSNQIAYDLAVKYNFQLLKAKSLLNKGNIYFSLDDTLKSKQNIVQALAIYEELQDKKGRAFSYMAMGNISAKGGKFEKAKDYYQKSLAIKQQLNDELGVAKTLSNIGLILKMQNKLDEALEYSFKSLEIKKRLNTINAISNTLSNVSEIYLLKKDYANSLEYAKNAYEYALKGNNMYYKRSALETIYQVQKVAGKKEELLATLELYKVNVDSLYKWEKEQEASEKQTDELISFNEMAKIQRLPLKTNENNTNLSKWLYAFITLSGILLIIVLFLVVRLRKKTNSHP